MAILSVKDLKKTYRLGFSKRLIPKKQEVLKGVSFELQPGMITGFLGANGAGKTTTMKCLLGLAFPDSGEINYFGQEKLSSAVKRRIGFLPERPYFYDYLTGSEFLQFYGELSGRLKKKPLQDRIYTLLEKVDLVHAKDKKLRGYSKGMLQKIGLAQALIHEPELVILDEPMAGLDPDGRMYLSDLIQSTAAEGTAVFFSSHLLHDAERLCKNLVVLKDGIVKYQGGTLDLLKKMGGSSVVTYVDGDQKKTSRAEDDQALQKEIDRLRSSKKTILDVRHDRNLEEAFTQIGLRGQNL